MNEMMRAFDVTDADVAALRQGRLSDRLQRRVRRARRWWLPLVGLALIVGSAAPLFTLPDDRDPARLIVGVFMLIVGVIVIAGYAAALRELRDPRIERVTGVLTREPRDQPTPQCLIDGEPFIVNRLAAHDALETGRTYTAYYLSRTREILYAERVQP